MIKIFWSSQLGRIARLTVIFEIPSFSQKAAVPCGIKNYSFAVFAPSIQAETNYNFRPDGERENGKLEYLIPRGTTAFCEKEGV